MAGNMAVTAVLCIIVLLALFFSGFFILLFIKRKRLRTAETAPVHILLTTLAVIDLLAAIFWTLLAAISAVDGEWNFTDALCKLQVFITIFFVLMNAHIMLALMFERFLRVYKPSKHVEIVFDAVVLLLVATLTVLDAAIAACPLWGWGKAEYFTKQYQCATNYEESAAHLDFTIAMHHGIPGSLTVIFYVLVIARVFYLKHKLEKNQQIVLEKVTGADVPGASYADKLKSRYQRLRDGTKDPDKTFKKEEIKDNGAYKHDEHDSTDEDCEKKKKDPLSKTSKTENTRVPQRVYYLTKADVRQAHLYAIMAIVFHVLWIPYLHRSVIVTHYFFEKSVSDGFILAAVILSHFTVCYKVPLYLISDKIRSAVCKTLGIGVNEKKKYASEEPIENTTTV